MLDSNKVDSSSNSSRTSGSGKCSEMITSQKYADQLKDLVSFEGSLELTNSVSARTLKQGDENQEGCDVIFPDGYGNGRIDTMIRTHIKRFAEVAEETTPIEGTLLDSSGLVKRRLEKRETLM